MKVYDRRSYPGGYQRVWLAVGVVFVLTSAMVAASLVSHWDTWRGWWPSAVTSVLSVGILTMPLVSGASCFLSLPTHATDLEILSCMSVRSLWARLLPTAVFPVCAVMLSVTTGLAVAIPLAVSEQRVPVGIPHVLDVSVLVLTMVVAHVVAALFGVMCARGLYKPVALLTAIVVPYLLPVGMSRLFPLTLGSVLYTLRGGTAYPPPEWSAGVMLIWLAIACGCAIIVSGQPLRLMPRLRRLTTISAGTGLLLLVMTSPRFSTPTQVTTLLCEQRDGVTACLPGSAAAGLDDFLAVAARMNERLPRELQVGRSEPLGASDVPDAASQAEQSDHYVHDGDITAVSGGGIAPSPVVDWNETVFAAAMPVFERACTSEIPAEYSAIEAAWISQLGADGARYMDRTLSTLEGHTKDLYEQLSALPPADFDSWLAERAAEISQCQPLTRGTD